MHTCTHTRVLPQVHYSLHTRMFLAQVIARGRKGTRWKMLPDGRALSMLSDAKKPRVREKNDAVEHIDIGYTHCTTGNAGAAEHITQPDGKTERVSVNMRMASGRVLYTEHLALSDKKILRDFIIRAAFMMGVQVPQVGVLIAKERFNAGSANDPLLEMSAVQTLLHAHEDGNGAGIDVTVVIAPLLLAPDELPELRQRSYRMRQLEEEACTWIKAQKSDVDLTSEWPNWKLYIARHVQSEKIVGPGILSFTTKLFPYPCFNPRGPVPELGFHINKSNGGEVRIQPGLHGNRALFFAVSHRALLHENRASEWLHLTV